VQAPKGRETPRRKPLDRRILLIGAAVIVVVAAGALWIAFSGGSTANNPPPQIAWSTVPGLQTGPPPWGPNVQTLPGRLPLIGLSQLTAEGTALHTHQHLDLWVNGKKVALAPGTGINDNTWITEIHVHPGEPNVIHVESPERTNFYLGQFFGVWGVRLTTRCVGSFCGTLHWWVNGKAETGNPADLRLADHQEIAIALGKPPAEVPASFDFAQFGL
jgi:hypothetical protein